MLIIQQVIAFIPFAIPMTDFNILKYFQCEYEYTQIMKTKDQFITRNQMHCHEGNAKPAGTEVVPVSFQKLGESAYITTLQGDPKDTYVCAKIMEKSHLDIHPYGILSPGKHEKFSHECTAQLRSFRYQKLV